jgi:hypothetical protein
MIVHIPFVCMPSFQYECALLNTSGLGDLVIGEVIVDVSAKLRFLLEVSASPQIESDMV